MGKETKKKKKTTGSSKKATTKPKAKNTSTKTSAKSNVKEVKKVVVTEEISEKVEKKELKKDIESQINVIKEEKNDSKVLLNSELGSLIKIIVIIACVLVAAILVTNIINSKRKTNDNLVTSADIQYDEILISNIMKQKKSSYYVFVYDAEDLYYPTYSTYLYMYENKENSMRLYYASLNSGFNKGYLNEEESNIVGASLDTLKFKGTTLVKVENGKIVNAYEGSDAIIEYLKSIAK